MRHLHIAKVPYRSNETDCTFEIHLLQVKEQIKIKVRKGDALPVIHGVNKEKAQGWGRPSVRLGRY